MERVTNVRGRVPEEYAGHCLRCGATHRFVNETALAVSALDALFDDIAKGPEFQPFRAALEVSGGKMVGVLVASDAVGRRHVLRGYSGEIANRTDWPGFVGPVIRREDTAALEAETLPRLAEMKRIIDANGVELAREALAKLKADLSAERAIRRQKRAEARFARGLQRRAGVDARAIEESRDETLREEQAIRDEEEARLAAARDAVEREQAKLRELREERRLVSVNLWEAMLDAARLTNARGERVPIREVFGSGRIPGGTTDCAVPRLLEAANRAGFRPIALAEAWWGPTLNGRSHGDLQAPCERKCQPILGHLLCGGAP